MSEDKQPVVETKIEVKRSKGGFFFGLFLLVLVLGLAGVGYILIEQIRVEHKGMGGEIDRDDQKLQKLSEQIDEYQQQFTAVQSHLTDIKAEVTNLESAATNNDQAIKQTLAEFSGLHSEKLAANKKELLVSIKQIKRQLGKTRGDWLIADAEYLLSVANQRLHLLADFHTTIEAMEAADQRLRESGDAGVFVVREQLVKELALLKAVETVDIVGIYAKIKYLIDNAKNLTVFYPYAGKPGTKSADIPEELDISGIEAVDDALEGLKDIVTIRRTKQPVKAIISSDNASFIREQLKVKLQIAVISLVNHNEKIYLSSLDDAKSWVQENFSDNSDAQNYIKEINSLIEIPLHSDLPDISLSLKMLRDISKLRVEADKALFEEQVGILASESEVNNEAPINEAPINEAPIDDSGVDDTGIDDTEVDNQVPTVEPESNVEEVIVQQPPVDDSQQQ